MIHTIQNFKYNSSKYLPVNGHEKEEVRRQESEDGMRRREGDVHRDGNRLHCKMSQAKMGGGLVVGGISEVEPHLSKEPGVFRITGDEDLGTRRTHVRKQYTVQVLCFNNELWI